MTLQDILDPSYLSQIQNYELLTKRAVEGFISGLHKSIRLGAGTEFVSYREYVPGDDLKHLDYKVLARTGKLLLKTYLNETNTQCNIILDCSLSHDYQGPQASCTKFRYAQMMAACLAYLSHRQGDQVGFYAYSDTLKAAVPASGTSGQLRRVLQAIARLKAEGVGSHLSSLTSLAQRFRHRGMVVFISDMLEAEEVLPSLLQGFHKDQCHCLAVQLLDAEELELTLEGAVRLEGLEDKRKMNCRPFSIARLYKTDMDAWLEDLGERFHQTATDYLRLDTNESIGTVLARYLHDRETRLQV